MKTFQTGLAIKFNTILSNLNKYYTGEPFNVSYEFKHENERLWLSFQDGKQTQAISFPVPYKDKYGNLVVGRRVVRAVGTWFHKEREFSYWALMLWLMTGRIEEAFDKVSKRSQLERLIVSFERGNSPMVFRGLQDLIDGIVNRLPLTGTPMETWAMCKRVVFLDPNFDELNPGDALKYQVEANKKFFPWTSMGLSDSGMCNNNLLKVDLRKYTPFGVKHHNPGRNLYQTLGMKGEEAPLLLTKSAADLRDKQGVERRGWNWMTCFLDTPLNFEDQLIVDVRHLDKLTLERKRFVCFGEVNVKSGDELYEGDVISIEPNDKPLCFWNKCDRAMVTEVEKDRVFFNGKDTEVTLVYVDTKHTFKEGIKLTNCHGNKGVVTFADCGTMTNAASGEEILVDIIVSAKTIGKRKNYGQVLETLLTLIRGKENPIVISDEAEVTIEELKESLTKRGHNEDGTSQIRNQWFPEGGKAICGWNFWGLIKNPENQLWTKAEVLAVDNQGRRKAGLKLSHIELKGLTTIFGPGNPIVDEILSHQQGVDGVCEMVSILESLRGKSIECPIINWSAIKPLSQVKSYFHVKGEIEGTVVDEHLAPEGFAIELPRILHFFSPEDEKSEFEYNVLPEGFNDFQTVVKEGGQNIFIDKVYASTSELRSCWEHSTGLWGLSDVGGHLNNIVSVCHNLVSEETTDEDLSRALRRYYTHIARRLSTKRGEISTYALAVRYPHSVKATATLAKQGLPKNHIEIHSDMAEDLGVLDGGFVIAERFPCLGFKSLRIQKVVVTNDPQCKYVIRVSGNSLVSQNLDFDGDVVFLMSFKTKEANELLKKEFEEPCRIREAYIDECSAKKVPNTASCSLDDIGLTSFPTLTVDKQAEIVEGLIGIKRGTGTIVALSYNLMRILEGTVGFKDKEANLALEVILDQVANSVFSQKHAGVSLEERCKKAVCTADFKDMLEMGFPEVGSRKLCEVVTEEANSLGITDLKKHYDKHLTEGKSNVVNTIVRRKRKFYFATRANLPPVRLLQHLDSKPVDLPSYLWQRALRIREGKNVKTDMSSLRTTG